MADPNNPFSLKTPCGNCPFRKDKKFYLSKARAEEISDSLKKDGSIFNCHKTIDYGDEEGSPNVTKKTKVCAGSLSTMENEGLSNRMMNIGRALGIYKPEELNPNSPVYDSLEEWVKSMEL